jgi:hypothetical protein
MGLDLWFREDVARILASTQEALRAVTRATAPLDPEVAEAYRQGFADALQAVGVAFGVAGPAGSGPGRGVQAAPIVDGKAWRQGPSEDRRAGRNGGEPE